MKSKNHIAEQIAQVFTDVTEEVVEQIGQRLEEEIHPAIAELATHLPGRSDWEKSCQQLARQIQDLHSKLGLIGSNSELLEHANKTIRQLNEQFYEERIILPMVRGLFPLLDLIETGLEKLEDQGINARHTTMKYLLAIKAQVEQFLAGYGIECYRHEADEPFDPRTMKPLKTLITCDPELEGRIAESMQCGFKRETRVLRMETVRIYQYEAANSTLLLNQQEGTNQ